MSKALHDFRGKLTTETSIALKAEMATNGGTEQDIVRQVMHEWAQRKIHAASVMSRLLLAEGVAGAPEGTSGQRRAR